MNSQTAAFGALSPALSRRPSISSRLSFAVSNAEQGEASAENGPREGQIEEEIAEIKRYEVSKRAHVTVTCTSMRDPLQTSALTFMVSRILQL